MMEFLVALLMIVCGAFMVFLGLAIGFEAYTTTYGTELVMWGFTSVVCIISGLIFMALTAEM